jgi:hypothetical protein
MSGTPHPSDYALDRGGFEIETHVRACAACQARTAAAKAQDGRFVTDVFPRTLGRVRARVAADARHRHAGWWRRPGWMAGAAVAAAAGFVLLARPLTTPRPTAVRYEGIKGPATAAPSVMTVFVKRGQEVWAFDADRRLRAGDALRFVARLDRARYLELRARDTAGNERTLFPEGNAAVLVQPAQALPGGFIVDAAPGSERLTVILGDRPFPVGRAPTNDLQVVRVELPKEP